MHGTYDVIIAGLGAMGSAAAYHLARRGSRVLGLDRFHPPHARGSSHGQTRIIREAYFEHPSYVPLVRRAYELWDELGAECAAPLWLRTGGLMIGAPDGVVVRGAQRSGDEHRLPYETLTAPQIRQRFPALRPADSMCGVFEPRAGILYPEQCVAAHLRRARECGAELHCEETVLSWTPDGAGARVRTDKETYRAGRLVVTAGAWAASLLPELKLPLSVERQVLFWFEPAVKEVFQPERCPVHLWEYEAGKFFYGFPDLGGGVKLARHHEGEFTDPDRIRREVGADEVAAMRELVRPFLPDAAGALREAVVCLYTNTPDGHFLLDAHPGHPQVLIVSPCSGHGFKFSAAIGEIVGDLLRDGRTRFDIGLFRHRAAWHRAAQVDGG